MSDPAVEAVSRAYRSADYEHHGPMLSAAREALKPLRELHRPIRRTPSFSICATCHGPSGRALVWPCDSAMLIYPESELAQ